ncbi:hypothetical protein SAMN05421829_1015 [Aromatoleum tolulyticum]|uniref:Uncharacterized protein n=1 Tax=Aromatoleum tolulyticum TaxID=34027 RepID=A0A1N6N2Q8_9RHOO|nr:pilus assembly protein [Aromatoleum tolulyticum]SIP86343.1 hypothetical protein SAMN05421829_1015 [Aromatoleum tolulyticum]
MTQQAKLILAGVIAATLAGCSTTPLWDARFGDPVRVIAAQQVIDPDASRNTDPVKGIDGQAAQGTMGEYQKSFVQPEPQTTSFSIGVGGQSGK